AFEEGVHELHRRLAKADAPSAQRLHPNDLRRIVRALEVWELTGRPISEWQQQWGNEPVSPAVARCWWIDRPRPELYRRIDARVESMSERGWTDETRRLLELPHPLSRGAGFALGYREILDYLKGMADLNTTVELIKTHTRQFAKRQLTWFRNMPECQRVEVVGDRVRIEDFVGLDPV